MKKQIILLLLALFVNTIMLNAQDMESPEFEKNKGEFYKPLGVSNGNVYYYNVKRVKDDIKINVFKYKESTLELIEEKEVFSKNIAPKVFKSNCQVSAHHKNGKFYFFYSVIYSGDYIVSMVTVDENLSNAKETEIGTIVETGYELLGDFQVAMSPDNKSAVVALKNYCEGKKAIGTNTRVIFENTELVYVNLINQTAVYKKRLPIELEESRVKTEQYKTDNEGNITLIVSITDRKALNSIKAIGFGFLKKEDKDLKINEINTEGSGSISSKLMQSKNGDLVYFGNLGGKVLLKVLPTDNSKKMFEASVSKHEFEPANMPFTALYKVSESDNGYYLTFFHKQFNSYEKQSVAFISKTGEFKWHKMLPVVVPIHYNSNGNMGVNSIYYNNKQYVFFTENKPYELTPKIEKMIASNTLNAEYNNENTNTVMYTLDETGKFDKKVVHDNAIYGNVNGVLGADAADAKLIEDTNILLMPVYGKKVFRLKKINIK
ncbi:MAG: hypothetical protein V4677_05660 [Bacteroidota bacterium]